MMKAVIAAAAGLTGVAGANVTINEFLPNPTGTDPATTTVELRGEAGTMFSGFLINIDSDGPTSGTAFAIVNPTGSVAISGMFDANGLLVVNIPDFENPSFGLILASNELAAGADLDANNDGLFDDVSVFGTVFDSVFANDVAADSALSAALAAQIGGTNLGFSGLTGNSAEPLLVFRDRITGDAYQIVSDGTTSFVYDAAGSIVDASLFDIDPFTATFGGVNPTVIPAPAAAGLLGLGGLVAARRRRA